MLAHQWASGQVLGVVADWWPVLRIEALLRGVQGAQGAPPAGEAGRPPQPVLREPAEQ